MPPKTAGKTPLIVYLDDEDHAKLREVAKEQNRTLSGQARFILSNWLLRTSR
jgi:hypothetical protein